MTSIGDTLRRERQRRSLEIQRISDELKISTRFLEAMERDDFGKLPGGVFTKSFVRQYAEYLGLDAGELASEVERAAEPEAEAVPLSSRPKPDVPVIDLRSSADWHSFTDRRLTLPSWFRAGVLLVGLMVVCSVIYWWWQRPRPAVMAHESKPAPAAAPVVPPVTSPPQAAAKTEPVAPPAETPAAASTPAATADAKTAGDVPAKPAVAVLTPNPNASVRVSITADEEVWVRAVVNGQNKFEGTLEPKETRNIDADGEVTLRLGNAGGATVTLNGKPVDVGPKGQARTIQFTSGGFQIVSPPPKLPDPGDRR